MLYHSPQDPFVATMVGAPTMNLIPATLGRNGAGPVIALPFQDVDGARWSEPLGDVTILDLDAAGTLLKTVLPEDEAVAYAVGDELDVGYSLADAHLFFRETGVHIG